VEKTSDVVEKGGSGETSLESKRLERDGFIWIVKKQVKREGSFTWVRRA